MEDSETKKWPTRALAMLAWRQPHFARYEWLVMRVGLAWLVWLTVTCVVHALVDNARMFRQLAGDVPIDVFNTPALIPFGRMVVSSTLVVIGAQAMFSIIWLGGDISVWSTIPGLVPTTVALVYLFVAPLWPLHKRLKRAKLEQLSLVQQQINRLPRASNSNPAEIGLLLALRREVTALAEWPLDLGVVARFGLYLVTVPLTWIGAALIENMVDMLIA